MAYTLKSNSTTAAISRAFVAENGLVEMIGGAAIAATGADMTASTVGGHVVYGFGADGRPAAQSLTLAGVAAIPANTKYAVLLVGAFGASPDDDLLYIGAPGPGQNQFGSGYNGTGGAMRSVVNYNQNKVVPIPSGTLCTLIYGRDASGNIQHAAGIVGGATPTIANATAGGANSWTIDAGSWTFGGSPGGGNARFGVGIHKVFIGVSPTELATYLGNDPYAALYDTGSGGGSVKSGRNFFYRKGNSNV